VTSSQAETALSYALAHGAKLISVNPIRASLEEYFFQEIGAHKN
jgi:hypothetical protein